MPLERRQHIIGLAEFTVLRKLPERIGRPQRILINERSWAWESVLPDGLETWPLHGLTGLGQPRRLLELRRTGKLIIGVLRRHEGLGDEVGEGDAPRRDGLTVTGPFQLLCLDQ